MGLTFIDFFAGIGGFRKGLENAGHKCIGFCEWDKFATMSYMSMHTITEEQRQYLSTLDFKQRQKEILDEKYLNGEWYINDVKKVNSRNIPKADIYTFGAPCFVAGTLITTSDGYKPIEQVQIGDKVLTHNNTYETVTELMINKKVGIYTLKVMGSPSTEVTGNHRFFVRYRNRKWNSEKRCYDTYWTVPEWKAVENFTGKEYIKFPNNLNIIKNDMNINKEDAWLLGRYVADGYLQDYPRKDRPSNIKRVALCISKDKLCDFQNHIIHYHYNMSNLQDSCYKCIFTDKRLFSLCEMCGKGAKNKQIPNFIMFLPNEILEEFINGYMSGDGNCKNDKYRATSVSKTLIYQLGQCVNKLYKCGYQIHHCIRPKSSIICGRRVNQNDTWELVYHLNRNKTLSYIDDNSLWQPIRKITYEADREEIVYNLEVENAHSYTANNLAAHNCQDFSVAGKRRGLEGDRSSLVHEIFRIIREQHECDRPEWLIYENVKGMLSSNRGFDFLAILLEMDELGYDCEWQTFNTRYFGIPQNRERIYTVGHLRTRGPRKLFPLQSSNRTDSISKINIIGHRDGFRRNTQVFDPNGAVEAIDTAEGGGRGHHTAIPLGMLRNVRNDYAKSIRKDYENGNIDAKRSELSEKEIRTDNITNTIDTVQKDNLLAVGINKIENIYESNSQNGDVFTVDDISPTLRSRQGEKGNGIGSNNSPKVAIPIVDNAVVTIKAGYANGIEETDVSPTLMARNYKGISNQSIAAVAIPVMTPEKENKRANGRRFKENEDPSFTLTTIDRHGVAVGINPKSGVYLGESEKFASPFLDDCSRTLKASNDAGIVLTVDINENDNKLAETTISNKIDNNKVTKQSKSKSLFALKSTEKQSNKEDYKVTKGLYVKLNATTTVYCVWYEKYQQYIAIRKLTPKENFRLQGWSDEYFERAKFVNSDSQLYKQAGNGVTVAVVEEIGKALYNL